MGDKEVTSAGHGNEWLRLFREARDAAAEAAAKAAAEADAAVSAITDDIFTAAESAFPTGSDISPAIEAFVASPFGTPNGAAPSAPSDGDDSQDDSLDGALKLIEPPAEIRTPRAYRDSFLPPHLHPNQLIPDEEIENDNDGDALGSLDEFDRKPRISPKLLSSQYDQGSLGGLFGMSLSASREFKLPRYPINLTPMQKAAIHRRAFMAPLVAELEALLGPHTRTGAFSLTAVPVETFDEFVEYLKTHAAINDNMSFTTPFCTLLGKAEFRPLLQALYERINPDASAPFKKSSDAEPLLRQFTAELIKISPSAFVSTHFSSAEGRDRLRRAVNGFYGYDMDLSADLCKAIADTAEGVVGAQPAGEVTSQISSFNYLNIAVTGEESRAARDAAMAIFDRADEVFAEHEERFDRLAEEPVEPTLPFFADRETVKRYAVLARKKAGKNDPVSRLQMHLANAWLLVAASERWVPEGSFYSYHENFVRRYIANRAKKLIAAGDKVNTEDEFRQYNDRVQRFLHQELFCFNPEMWILHKSSGASLVSYMSDLPAHLRPLFDGLSAYSDKLHHAMAMGRRIPPAAPVVKIDGKEKKAAVTLLVIALQEVVLDMWYSYKQHRAISRAGSNVRMSATGEGDIADIRRAESLVDGFIRRLENAKNTKEIKAVVVKLYQSLQAGGDIHAALLSAEMEGTEQLLGFGQTAVEFAVLALATKGLGIPAAVSRLAIALRMFGAGAFIAFSENTIAVATDEVRQNGQDTLISWLIDSTATGFSMAVMAFLRLPKSHHPNILRRLHERYTSEGFRGFAGTFAANAGMEPIEELLDQYVNQTLHGDFGALSWEEVTEIFRICAVAGVTGFAQAKVGVVAEFTERAVQQAIPAVPPTSPAARRAPAASQPAPTTATPATTTPATTSGGESTASMMEDSAKAAQPAGPEPATASTGAEPTTALAGAADAPLTAAEQEFLDETYKRHPELRGKFDKTGWTERMRHDLIKLLAEKAGNNVDYAYENLDIAIDGMRGTGWSYEEQRDLLALLAEMLGDLGDYISFAYRDLGMIIHEIRDFRRGPFTPKEFFEIYAYYLAQQRATNDKRRPNSFRAVERVMREKLALLGAAGRFGRFSSLSEAVEQLQGVQAGDGGTIDRLKQLAENIAAVVDGNVRGVFRQTIHDRPLPDNIAYVERRMAEARAAGVDSETIAQMEETLSILRKIYGGEFDLSTFRAKLDSDTANLISWPSSDTPTMDEVSRLAVSLRRAWDAKAEGLPPAERLALVRMAISLQRFAYASFAAIPSEAGTPAQAKKMAALVEVLYGSGYGNAGWLALARRLRESGDGDALKHAAVLVSEIVREVESSYDEHVGTLARQHVESLFNGDERAMANYLSEQPRSMAVFVLAEHARQLGVPTAATSGMNDVLDVMGEGGEEAGFKAHPYHESNYPQSHRSMGGKGLGLHRLAMLFGDKTPRGFTLPARGGDYRLTEADKAEIRRGIEELERQTGKKFGKGLKVSVRSGAAISMPGAMRTTLWVKSYNQLFAGIEKVYASWNSAAARAHRERLGIPDEWGTAVSVVEMKDARGKNSGSGIVSSGAGDLDIAYGERVSGDEIVSGRHVGADTLPPELEKELKSDIARMEDEFGYPVEAEFTVENGRLWYLQVRRAHLEHGELVKWHAARVRSGKISREAAIEALGGRAAIEAARNQTATLDVHGEKPIHEGTIGSGNPYSGQVVFSAAAVEAMEAGAAYIYATANPDARESTADAMKAGAMLVFGGNALSHLRAVAKGLGMPVMDAAAEIDGARRVIRLQNGEVIREGDVITLDPQTGRIYRGQISTRTTTNTELNAAADFILSPPQETEPAAHDTAAETQPAKPEPVAAPESSDVQADPSSNPDPSDGTPPIPLMGPMIAGLGLPPLAPDLGTSPALSQTSPTQAQDVARPPATETSDSVPPATTQQISNISPSESGPATVDREKMEAIERDGTGVIEKMHSGKIAYLDGVAELARLAKEAQTILADVQGFTREDLLFFDLLVARVEELHAKAVASNPVAVATAPEQTAASETDSAVQQQLNLDTDHLERHLLKNAIAGTAIDVERAEEISEMIVGEIAKDGTVKPLSIPEDVTDPRWVHDKRGSIFMLVRVKFKKPIARPGVIDIAQLSDAEHARVAVRKRDLRSGAYYAPTYAGENTPMTDEATLVIYIHDGDARAVKRDGRTVWMSGDEEIDGTLVEGMPGARLRKPTVVTILAGPTDTMHPSDYWLGKILLPKVKNAVGPEVVTRLEGTLHEVMDIAEAGRIAEVWADTLQRELDSERVEAKNEKAVASAIRELREMAQNARENWSGGRYAFVGQGEAYPAEDQLPAETAWARRRLRELAAPASEAERPVRGWEERSAGPVETKGSYTPSQTSRFEISGDSYSQARMAFLRHLHGKWKSKFPVRTAFSLFGSLSKGKVLDAETVPTTDIDLAVLVDVDDLERQFQQLIKNDTEFARAYRDASSLPEDTSVLEYREFDARNAVLMLFSRFAAREARTGATSVEGIPTRWDLRMGYEQDQLLPEFWRGKIRIEGISESGGNSIENNVRNYLDPEDLVRSAEGYSPNPFFSVRGPILRSLKLKIAMFFHLDVGGGLESYRRAFFMRLARDPAYNQPPQKRYGESCDCHTLRDHMWHTIRWIAMEVERGADVSEGVKKLYPESFKDAYRFYVGEEPPAESPSSNATVAATLSEPAAPAQGPAKPVLTTKSTAASESSDVQADPSGNPDPSDGTPPIPLMGPMIAGLGIFAWVKKSKNPIAEGIRKLFGIEDPVVPAIAQGPVEADPVTPAPSDQTPFSPTLLQRIETALDRTSQRDITETLRGIPRKEYAEDEKITLAVLVAFLERRARQLGFEPGNTDETLMFWDKAVQRGGWKGLEEYLMWKGGYITSALLPSEMRRHRVAGTESLEEGGYKRKIDNRNRRRDALIPQLVQAGLDPDGAVQVATRIAELEQRHPEWFDFLKAEDFKRKEVHGPVSYKLRPSPEREATLRERARQALVDYFPELTITPDMSTDQIIPPLVEFLEKYREAERYFADGGISDDHCGASAERITHLLRTKGFEVSPIQVDPFIFGPQFNAVHPTALVAQIAEAAGRPGITVRELLKDFSREEAPLSSEKIRDLAKDYEIPTEMMDAAYRRFHALTPEKRLAITSNRGWSHTMAVARFGGRNYLIDINRQQFGRGEDRLVVIPLDEAAANGIFLWQPFRPEQMKPSFDDEEQITQTVQAMEQRVLREYLGLPPLAPDLGTSPALSQTSPTQAQDVARPPATETSDSVPPAPPAPPIKPTRDPEAGSVRIPTRRGGRGARSRRAPKPAAPVDAQVAEPATTQQIPNSSPPGSGPATVDREKMVAAELKRAEGELKDVGIPNEPGTRAALGRVLARFAAISGGESKPPPRISLVRMGDGSVFFSVKIDAVAGGEGGEFSNLAKDVASDLSGLGYGPLMVKNTEGGGVEFRFVAPPERLTHPEWELRLGRSNEGIRAAIVDGTAEGFEIPTPFLTPEIEGIVRQVPQILATRRQIAEDLAGFSSIPESQVGSIPHLTEKAEDFFRKFWMVITMGGENNPRYYFYHPRQKNTLFPPATKDDFLAYRTWLDHNGFPQDERATFDSPEMHDLTQLFRTLGVGFKCDAPLKPSEARYFAELIRMLPVRLVKSYSFKGLTIEDRLDFAVYPQAISMYSKGHVNLLVGTIRGARWRFLHTFLHELGHGVSDQMVASHQPALTHHLPPNGLIPLQIRQKFQEFVSLLIGGKIEERALYSPARFGDIRTEFHITEGLWNDLIADMIPTFLGEGDKLKEHIERLDRPDRPVREAYTFLMRWIAAVALSGPSLSGVDLPGVVNSGKPETHSPVNASVLPSRPPKPGGPISVFGDDGEPHGMPRGDNPDVAARSGYGVNPGGADTTNLLNLGPHELNPFFKGLEAKGQLEAFLESALDDPSVVAMLSHWEKYLPREHQALIEKIITEKRKVRTEEDILPLGLERRFTDEELEVMAQHMESIQLTFGCSIGCPLCGFDAVRGKKEELPYDQVERFVLRFGRRIRKGTLLYFASEPSDHSRYRDIHELVKKHAGYTPHIRSRNLTDSEWLAWMRTQEGAKLSALGLGRASLDHVEAMAGGAPTMIGNGTEFTHGLGVDSQRVKADNNGIACADGVVVTPRGVYNVVRVRLSREHPQGMIVEPLDHIAREDVKVGDDFREVIRTSIVAYQYIGYTNGRSGKLLTIYRNGRYFDITVGADSKVRNVAESTYHQLSERRAASQFMGEMYYKAYDRYDRIPTWGELLPSEEMERLQRLTGVLPTDKVTGEVSKKIYTAKELCDGETERLIQAQNERLGPNTIFD